jgi:ATP-dependent Clp protease protease subunit
VHTRTHAPAGDAGIGPDAHASFWSSLPDAAFFADGPAAPVQHVYMYGVVDADSLRRLRADIEDACRGAVDPASGVQLAPRPIVLHVNSPGGSMFAGFSMMSVLNECRAPLCACVDGISYSAGTFVSVLAPYRVMAPMATCLVHDYASVLLGKGDDLRFQVGEADAGLAVVRDMYTRRTRGACGPAQLDELMQRDLVLDAPRCLALGICDRVLDASASAPANSGAHEHERRTRLPTLVVLRKTNLNHVRFECAATGDHALGAVLQLSALLGAGAALKPVVLHADGLSCLSSVTDHVAPLAARVQALAGLVDTYGVVDTHIDLVNLLPILLCRRRIMYTHARVRIHLVYDRAWAWMLRDSTANTAQMLDAIRAVLRAHTRLPAELVDAIDRKRTLLSAEDCLRWGVVDELVSV